MSTRARPPLSPAEVLQLRVARTTGSPSVSPERRLPNVPVAKNVSQRFGYRLRTLRAARNLTQQEMARKFGIDRSFISDVERGRKSVSLVTLEILAIGLGLSIAELLHEV